jgi:hypothetical protein
MIFMCSFTKHIYIFFFCWKQKKVDEHRSVDAICKYILIMWEYKKGHCQLTLTSDHHTLGQN